MLKLLPRPPSTVRTPLTAQEKALTAIVDAKAAAKQDSEASEKSMADQAVKNTAMGLEAMSQSL